MNYTIRTDISLRSVLECLTLKTLVTIICIGLISVFFKKICIGLILVFSFLLHPDGTRKSNCGSSYFRY